MSGSPRYLTKSRFKLACECGTKLFYTKKKDRYANSTLDDPFLAALADSGFQVGELAKCYYPGGVDIKPLDYDEALEETEAALSSGAPAIFEAAIRYKNLFVRADVLEMKGDTLHLLEVKAKSFDHLEVYTTAKRYSRRARELARRFNITLVTGKDLKRMLSKKRLSFQQVHERALKGTVGC
jgi:RNase P subunit RPR2